MDARLAGGRAPAALLALLLAATAPWPLEGGRTAPAQSGAGGDATGCLRYVQAPEEQVGIPLQCPRRPTPREISLVVRHPASVSQLVDMLAELDPRRLEVIVEIPDSQRAELQQLAEALGGADHFVVVGLEDEGNARGLNRLARMASSQVVALLTGDDARVLSKAWIVEALQIFHANPQLAVLSAAGEGNFELARDAPLGPLLVRREAFLDAGLFRPAACPGGCEDGFELELGWRAWLLGHQVGVYGGGGRRAMMAKACKGGAASGAAVGAEDAALMAKVERAMDVGRAGGGGRARASGRRARRDACAGTPRGASGGSCRPRPLVSVAIQYFRRPDMVAPVAAALGDTLAALGDDSAEVLVNNDSGDSHGEWAAALRGLGGGGARIVVRANDVHEIRAYNRLALLAEGELIALMQDDDLPGRRWLADASSLLSAHPDVAMLGGHRGRVDLDAGGGDPPMDTKRHLAKGMKYGAGHTGIPHVDPSTGLPFMFVYKANLAPLVLRRSVFLGLGMFHREFSCPGEPGINFDFEYSVRLWKRGHAVGLHYARFRRPSHEGKKQPAGGFVAAGGTRANKAVHRKRVENSHRNNAHLYQMYRGFHHREGSQLVERRNRALPAAGGGSAPPEG